jgi:hypothetical protein
LPIVGNHARPPHIQAHSAFATHKAKQKKRKELASCLRTKEKHNTMKKTTIITIFMLGKNKFI